MRRKWEISSGPRSGGTTRLMPRPKTSDSTMKTDAGRASIALHNCKNAAGNARQPGDSTARSPAAADSGTARLSPRFKLDCRPARRTHHHMLKPREFGNPGRDGKFLRAEQVCDCS